MEILQARPKLPSKDATEYRDVISQLEAAGGGLVLATCNSQDEGMSFRVQIHGLEVRECVIVAQRLIAHSSKVVPQLSQLAQLLDHYVEAMGVGPIHFSN